LRWTGDFSGKGLGHALISEAFKIALRVADDVGCRCIITDAYRKAIAWYPATVSLRCKARPKAVRSACISTSEQSAWR
jgi:hypothetical protein